MNLRQCFAACAMAALVLGTAGRVTAGQRRAEPRRDVAADHDHFDDHDRDVARSWYTNHHNALPLGLRERDRLSHDMELRLDAGFVLDRTWRARIHPVPLDLIRLLPPPPRGDRYVIVGGHICLINSRYEVRDVIHLGHDR
jgi:Ni/Co efflux regulator RcnB